MNQQKMQFPKFKRNRYFFIFSVKMSRILLYHEISFHLTCFCEPKVEILLTSANKIKDFFYAFQ